MAAVFEATMDRHGWKISRGSDGFEGGECELSKTVDVRIVPIQAMRRVQLTAAAWTLLSTSFVMDYLAPLVIAAAPVVVAVCEVAAHYSCALSQVMR
jgi:hypothetical protein